MTEITLTAPMTKKHLLRLYRWWVAELVAMLPGPLVRLCKRNRGVVRMQMGADAVLISRFADGNLQTEEQLSLPLATLMTSADAAVELLGKYDPGLSQIELCLPSEEVLHKTIELPTATEENIDEVIGFEMDRHTPFKPDWAYFHFRVCTRNATTIKVALQTISRAAVDELLRQLQACNIQVDRVYVKQLGDAFYSDDHFPLVNFLPLAQRLPKEKQLDWV